MNKSSEKPTGRELQIMLEASSKAAESRDKIHETILREIKDDVKQFGFNMKEVKDEVLNMRFHLGSIEKKIAEMEEKIAANKQANDSTRTDIDKRFLGIDKPLKEKFDEVDGSLQGYSNLKLRIVTATMVIGFLLSVGGFYILKAVAQKVVADILSEQQV